VAAGGFPDGFVWATTSSAVGTEGAARSADWYAWERERGLPASGDGNGWASDYADDARLLASLGLTALRVTVDWARLEPEPGRVDGARVEHERRVLASVRDAGLQPWVTLHHTAAPGWFSQDEGGFRDERARGYHWPRHVDRCAEWFEDLAAGWVPIEDPVGGALRGFLGGSRPPGRRSPEDARAAVLGALEANDAAWRLLRGGQAPVMCVLELPSTRLKTPPDADPDDAAWARVPWNAPVRALRDGVLDLPGGAELERPEMAGAFDVVGLAYVHYPPADGTAFDAAAEADALGEVIHRLAEELPDRAFAVAAHGLGTGDDKKREALLRATVDQLRAARRDGIDLRGYFHDTGIDGYDFATGFARPRGLLTRARELKDSAHWLQETLRSG
jgi:beta-glucosidase